MHLLQVKQVWHLKKVKHLQQVSQKAKHPLKVTQVKLHLELAILPISLTLATQMKKKKHPKNIKHLMKATQLKL